MILINSDEYENEFKKYENINENEIIEIFNSENNHNNSVTYEITNRLIFNAFELYKPFLYNSEILKEIINEYYENESDIYSEIKDEILTIIDENSSNYYFRNIKIGYYSNESKLMNKSYEYYEYIKAFSDSYSLKDILKIFDEITDAYKTKYELYQASENESKYESYQAFNLIEYIISELDSKLNLNLMNFKIALNISNSVITNNDSLILNDEFIDSEIHEMLISNDLNESILSELYESDIIDIYGSNNINSYELFENALINYYNESFNMNLEYVNMKCLIISISDILKLNEIISDSELNYKMKYDLESESDISELFENTNNELNENFLYGIYDEINELIYTKFSDEYYYELYSINSSKYHFMKIDNIHELIEIVLNELKHYDLRNSFKFNESCYEIY